MLIKEREMKLLIVDDEKEASENIKNILSQYVSTNARVVGTAYNTAEAEHMIKTLKPDAVLMDIEMPGENAFQLLDRIYHNEFEIVFITAYDDFAIRAFKLNAIDYILKPVNINELSEAMHKVQERINYKQFTHSSLQSETIKHIAGYGTPQNIILRALNHVEIIPFDDIYSLEGQGSYCRFAFRKENNMHEITTSYTISFYEELLPPQFYRVHRSFLINCRHLADIISGSDSFAVLKNRAEIPISRRRYGDFISFLREKNF